jgi:FtsH-binding integral membrane protein
MFAASGVLMVISGFYGFVAFRLGIAFVMLLLLSGLLLVGFQLIRSFRLYQLNYPNQKSSQLFDNRLSKSGIARAQPVSEEVMH